MFLQRNKCLQNIYLFSIFIITSGFSVNTFASFLSGIQNSLSFNSISYMMEQCDSRWVPQDLNGLEKDLRSSVFGQHLAIDVILIALQGHIQEEYIRKPLVLSFHGWSGGGKGFVRDFIVKHFYKKGASSKFVKKYLAKIHFPLEKDVHSYQMRLQKELEETVYKCSKALFIFDEVDKYPRKVLDGIKSYLDFSTNVNGYDFREAIFIFISNTGEQTITDITIRKAEEGIKREDLKIQDFDQILKTKSYNELDNDNLGGFYQSEIIRHHLIDYIIPFLPLEKSHVQDCVKAERINKRVPYAQYKEIIIHVMDNMRFIPQDNPLYSATGCKQVSELVRYMIVKDQRQKNKRYNSEL